MCEEAHDALKSLFNACPFCSLTFVEVEPKKFSCCIEMNILEDESIRRCTNCHWFEYPYASEYVDYYENRHRIKRKRAYNRKYQFFKVVSLMTCEIMWDEKISLFKIFEDLQEAIGYMKKSIKFTFLIRKILKMKGDDLYRCFPLPKTRGTMEKYEKLTNVPLKSLLKNKSFISFTRRE